MIRFAMHHAGAVALTQLLQFEPPDGDHKEVPRSCGHPAHFKEIRVKSFLSVVGTVEVLRPYYLCSHCSRGQHPGDGELGIAGLESSRGVTRMDAMLGAEMPFVPAREPMRVLAGLEVPAKAIERAAESIGTQIAYRDQQEIDRPKQVYRQTIPKMYLLMDGVHIPVVAVETEGRTGRIEGQPALTRECKLGAVFTQTTVDKERWPMRDPNSTTYLGAVETAAEFGFPIYSEAGGRGWEWATTKIVFGDSAVWIWNRRSTFSRRRADCRSLSCPATPVGSGRVAVSAGRVGEEALDGTHEGSVGLRQDGTSRGVAARNRRRSCWNSTRLGGRISKRADYFETNTHRMKYPKSREEGFFVGSGIFDRGSKTRSGSSTRAPCLRGEQSVQQALEGPHTASLPKVAIAEFDLAIRTTSDRNEWKHNRIPGKFGPGSVAGKSNSCKTKHS